MWIYTFLHYVVKMLLKSCILYCRSIICLHVSMSQFLNSQRMIWQRNGKLTTLKNQILWSTLPIWLLSTSKKLKFQSVSTFIFQVFNCTFINLNWWMAIWYLIHSFTCIPSSTTDKGMQVEIIHNHDFGDLSIDVIHFITILNSNYLAGCDIDEATQIYVSSNASFLFLFSVNLHFSA